MEKIEVLSYLKFINRDIKELLVKNVGVFCCFFNRFGYYECYFYYCSLFFF